MKPEAQRIAIAEACGIQPLVKFELISGQYIKIEGSEDWSECPDYLNDLNAMHEAWKTLNAQKHLRYMAQLRGICLHSGWPAGCATAAQRAEAFLLTLGLWK